jgi:glycosyltransferase involved in cell wall biosynthesis
MRKILCLTLHDLNAQDYGAVLRVRHVFQMLSRLGEVHVVLASRYKDVLEKAKPRQAGFELLDKIYLQQTYYTIAERVRRRFHPPFLDIEGYQAEVNDRKRLQTLMAEHDLTWVHSLEAANSFGIWRWPKAALDIDDIPSRVYQLRMSQAETVADKYRAYRRMVLWRRNEKSLAERFDAICVCSQLDCEKLGGGERIFVLPNGFKASQKTPVRNPVYPPQIGFVGTFVYWANCEGVQWFIKKVWPSILKQFPQVRLRLAGENGQNFFGGQNVDALGWVADMEREMSNWSLMIVPVLAGGGTRIKILEAFSRKCPVVSTSLGAYGHDVENGHELLIGDSAGAFAENCIRILKNPSEGERLAENGMNRFLQDGVWDSRTERVAEIVGSIWGNPALGINAILKPCRGLYKPEIHVKL